MTQEQQPTPKHEYGPGWHRYTDKNGDGYTEPTDNPPAIPSRAYLMDVDPRLEASQATVARLVDILRKVCPEPMYCLDCKLFISCDEDGCCATCGSDVIIIDFDAAIAEVQRETNERI